MLRSPYPFFGGKSTIAAEIWRRFGDCPNFIDPFFGSGAVLLARPHKSGLEQLELVNDIDGLIVNFWRAVQADAEAVAGYADWPAFENDLHARHAWLTSRKDSLREQLEGDPDFYDVKAAGWWVWGMSLWIGSGFCSGRGRWQSIDGKLVQVEDKPPSTVAEQLPMVLDRSLRADFVESYSGAGVSRKLPRVSEFVGVKRNRLALSGSPKGVHRQLPETVARRGDTASCVTRGIYAYFADLQARFRRVRVTCGDWMRVVTPAVLGAKSPCALLLDPPYTHAGRETDLYTHDEQGLYAQVREWALANGDNPALRIAYCGYEDGFVWSQDWTRLNWKANGGYSNQGDKRRTNAERETIWFSPHCLPIEQQTRLFE